MNTSQCIARQKLRDAVISPPNLPEETQKRAIAKAQKMDRKGIFARIAAWLGMRKGA